MMTSMKRRLISALNRMEVTKVQWHQVMDLLRIQDRGPIQDQDRLEIRSRVRSSRPNRSRFHSHHVSVLAFRKFKTKCRCSSNTPCPVCLGSQARVCRCKCSNNKEEPVRAPKRKLNHRVVLGATSNKCSSRIAVVVVPIRHSARASRD